MRESSTYLHFKNLNVHVPISRCFLRLKKTFRDGQKGIFYVWSGFKRTEIPMTNVLQQRNLDQISINKLTTIAINSNATRDTRGRFFS